MLRVGPRNRGENNRSLFVRIESARAHHPDRLSPTSQRWDLHLTEGIRQHECARPITAQRQRGSYEALQR